MDTTDIEWEGVFIKPEVAVLVIIAIILFMMYLRWKLNSEMED